MENILLENEIFCLALGEDCVAKSLLLKATGEELLVADNDLPLFSVTQERPYNNEIKLSHMNKQTTFSANRVRMEEGKLIVGFDLPLYEAVVDVKITSSYIVFTLEKFNVRGRHFYGIWMDTHPAVSFCLCSLPIKEKKQFGEWLNVMWDEKSAVCLLATSPHAEIDSQKCRGYRLLTAEAHRYILLEGCTATLIASPTRDFLDAVAKVEEDYGLPSGVESRRNSDKINASIYWSKDITPDTVERHIEYANRAGFRMMLLYYTCCFKEEGHGTFCGDYDLRDEYEGDPEKLRDMLDKIKAAGITPGLHFLHTYIGNKSRYVTPLADPRLNIRRHFTLASELTLENGEIEVLQNPMGCPKNIAPLRLLQFGTEIISYEGYTTERPYKFIGCKRGHFNTAVVPHEAGQVGGVLDASEFGFASLYLDQETDLMDEVAEKIAKVYDLGFEFAYFDGSEGTNPPFAYNVSNAQYRVYKTFAKPPLFCEGAAKSHFGWHMLSGANAFDVFQTDVFKRKIDEHPVREAPLMRQNFTRVNFGWWAYFENTRPDIYEYGMSRAASWDCPATMQANFEAFEKNPRTDDIFEVIRRWEDVRRRNWLTEEQKQMMHSSQEHILLINEEGEYELVPYEQIEGTPENLYAFTFKRLGKSYAVYWYQGEDKTVELPLVDIKFKCEEELGGEETVISVKGNATLLPASHRRYVSTSAGEETLVTAFKNAVVL